MGDFNSGFMSAIILSIVVGAFVFAFVMGDMNAYNAFENKCIALDGEVFKYDGDLVCLKVDKTNFIKVYESLVPTFSQEMRK